jgi:hypothetical protein
MHPQIFHLQKAFSSLKDTKRRWVEVWLGRKKKLSKRTLKVQLYFTPLYAFIRQPLWVIPSQLEFFVAGKNRIL